MLADSLRTDATTPFGKANALPVDHDHNQAGAVAEAEVGDDDAHAVGDLIDEAAAHAVEDPITPGGCHA